MSFNAFQLDSTINIALSDLNYHTPSPIQQAAIPVILQGKDVMAGAQTGTGKTAAFALPILHQLATNKSQRSGVKALVLTPTRELAQQVHANFCAYNAHLPFNVLVAYGGVSINPQIERLKQGADIVVATPGRLLDLLFKGVIDLQTLQYLVFDEADRMLDMGFKDQITNILKQVPLQRQTMLFSATFDQAIFQLSKTLLNDPELIEVDQRNSAASQVEQIVYTLDADRKQSFISYFIGSQNWQQVLVFTRTKQTAEALAKEMTKDGLKTASIHGDKSQGARDKALLQFKEGSVRVLVATDVAARGLDISDLSYVINYELPYVAEDYVHRIGRTGRAGKQGKAVSLVSPKESYLLTAIEEVLDEKLLQQWYPGFEPDLNKVESNSSPKKKQSKQHARRKALSSGNNGSRASANKKRNAPRRKPSR